MQAPRSGRHAVHADRMHSSSKQIRLTPIICKHAGCAMCCEQLCAEDGILRSMPYTAHHNVVMGYDAEHRCSAPEHASD